MASRVEISKRLVLINAASSVLARVINVSVVLWFQWYLLRRVSDTEYMLLPLLASVIVLLPLFTSILTSGLGRFVISAYAKNDDRAITQIVSTIFPLSLAAGLILLAVGLVFSWHVDKVLSIPPGRLWDARIMMALLMFSVSTRPPCAPFMVGLFARQKFVLQNIIGVCDEALRLVLLYILVVGVSARVLWVVVANVSCELCMTIVMIIASRRLVPALRFRVREIQWRRARELISFGGWNFLGIAAWRLRQTAIPLMLNKLATPVDQIVFALGFMPRQKLDQWVDVLAMPLYPVVTGMHAMGAKERVRAVFMRGGRIALWMMLLPALPAIIYSQTIVRLYAGPAYAEASLVMVLSLACLPLNGGVWMMWQVANATGRVRKMGVYALTTQLGIIAATFFLVGRLGWGGFGAAVAAFVFGAIATVAVAWRLGLKLADVKFDAWVRQTLIPGLAPGFVAAVVWAVLNVTVRPDRWVEVGLCTAAGALCYLTMLLVFCLEPKDREDLGEVIRRLRALVRPRVAVSQPISPLSATGSHSGRGVASAKPDVPDDGVPREKDPIAQSLSRE